MSYRTRSLSPGLAGFIALATTMASAYPCPGADPLERLGRLMGDGRGFSCPKDPEHGESTGKYCDVCGARVRPKGGSYL